MVKHKQIKKSILHVIDTTGPGGAETIFLNLVENLQIDGYRNIALIKGPGWVEQQLLKKNVEFYILKPYGLLSIPYYLHLIHFLRRQNVSLVQAHLLGSILTASIVCLVCRIPLIATMHGQVDINLHEKFVYFKHLVMKCGVNNLIAVSKSLADYIQNRGLFRHKKIEVIYNGIDTSRYNKSTHTELRAKLGLNNDTILIGSLGNIRPAKNYENLIETAAIINQHRGNNVIHFCIAGHKDLELINILEALAIKGNVASAVHFIGFIDDTPKFLSELDIFLLCSSSEGFSIATIEAMAARLPVIATKCGGPEEIITDSVNGFLVEKNNPVKLAEIITYLLDNPHKAESVAAEAQKHIEATFSLNTMSFRYKMLYNDLLQNN